MYLVYVGCIVKLFNVNIENSRLDDIYLLLMIFIILRQFYLKLYQLELNSNN